MKSTTTIKLERGAVSLPNTMQQSIALFIQFARKNAPLPLYLEGCDGTVLWAFLYIDFQKEEMSPSAAPTTETCTDVSNGRVLRIILPALIDSECLVEWLQSVAAQRLLCQILRGSALVREGVDYVGTFTNRARMAFEELRHQGMHLPIQWKAWTVDRWIEKASLTRLLSSSRSSAEIADIMLAKARKQFIYLSDSECLEPAIEELRAAIAR